MRILFCNIAWMDYYKGTIEGKDVPRNGGSYVALHNDAHESYNFDAVTLDEEVDDVLVIYCAKYPDSSTQETYVVGWYKNATVYRYNQTIEFPDTEGTML